MRHLSFPPELHGLERQYLSHERSRNRWVARIGTTTAAIIIFISTLVNYLSSQEVDRWWLSPLEFTAVSLVVWFVTESRLYLERPASDLLLAAIVWFAISADYFSGMKLSVLLDGSDGDQIRVFSTAVIYVFIGGIYSALLFFGDYRLYLIYTAAFLTLSFFGSAYSFGAMFAFRLTLASLIMFPIFIYINLDRERSHLRRFISQSLLYREKERTEELVDNMLPSQVVQRLKSGENVVDSFGGVVVIFTDLVAFSTFSRTISPKHLVSMLQEFFLAADKVAKANGIEKVKTIGDGYMAVAGGVASEGAGAADAIKFGLELIDETKKLREKTRLPVHIRIGIHVGPAVGGVIGDAKLTYDYWGETLNIAARIESAAPVDGLSVSSAVYHEVSDRYTFAEPVKIELKGVGPTDVYTLAGSAASSNCVMA